jgi:hypothetical protein
MLVAIPSTDQLEDLRLTARLVNSSVSIAAVGSEPEKMDLRFTERGLRFNSTSVGALMIRNFEDRDPPRKSEILLNLNCPNFPILFLHELGHYYDFCCFEPFGMFSSSIDSEFEPWRQTVCSTESFQINAGLTSFLSGKDEVVVSDSKNNHKVFTNTPGVDFETIFTEAFARCFCQWIVRRWERLGIQDAVPIIAHFNEEAVCQASKDYSLYWSDSEMSDIDPVMDELFGPTI